MTVASAILPSLLPLIEFRFSDTEAWSYDPYTRLWYPLERESLYRWLDGEIGGEFIYFSFKEKVETGPGITEAQLNEILA
jgi:hypothetical protein